MNSYYANDTVSCSKSDLDPYKYPASTALLKLVIQKQGSSCSMDVPHLTKLLQAPLEIPPSTVTAKVAQLSPTYNQSVPVGKLYRSKKRTLRHLQEFKEGTLEKIIAQRQILKRSPSTSRTDCSTLISKEDYRKLIIRNDPSAAIYRDDYSTAAGSSSCKTVDRYRGCKKQKDVVNANEVQKSEANVWENFGNEHLDKLSKLVQSIGLKNDQDCNKNTFYDVLSSYTPVQDCDQSLNSIRGNFMQINYPNQSSTVKHVPLICNDVYNEHFSSSPYPEEYFSNPCSPMVYPLETPLSASAPSLQCLIDDLRRHSTEEELKSSFGNIDVEDILLEENEVFYDLY